VGWGGVGLGWSNRWASEMMQNGMAECKLCGSKTTNSQAVQHVSRAYDRQKVEPTLHSSLKILLVVGDCFFIGIQVRKKERKNEEQRGRRSPCVFCILLLLYGCKSGDLGGYLWYDVDLDHQNGGIGNVDERRERFREFWNFRECVKSPVSS
jgi:hypothetical protein